MVKQDNAHCPVCGSRNCEGTHVEIETNSAFQPCWCNECGAQWNDVYEFTGCTDIWKEQLNLEEEL